MLTSKQKMKIVKAMADLKRMGCITVPLPIAIGLDGLAFQSGLRIGLYPQQDGSVRVALHRNPVAWKGEGQ